MAWGLLAKGLMGAGRVVGGAARTTGRGARMARRMFRRKGGKDAPKNPRHENPDISSYFGGGEAKVRPSSALVPFAAGATVGATAGASTTSSGGDDAEEIAIRIKTNLISVEKLLKNSAAYRENVREEERKKQERLKAADAEKKLEKDKPKQKNKFKLPVPKEVKSFWGNIMDFLMKVFLAQFMDQIINLRGPLMNIAKVLAKVADIALNIIGWIFNFAVTIVDGAYKLVDGMRGLVKNIFGEKGLKVFDSFLDIMVKVINAVVSVGMVFTALGGVGMVTKLIAWLKGGSAIASVAGGASGVGGTGGAAASAAGMGGAAAAGVVAGAGLLASGLGEGMGQLNKWGLEREKNWKKKAKDKWWTDPRKYFWAAAAGIMTVLNRFFGFLGALFDIIGAPFRMIIELIRFPFLDEEGKKKQAENLAKFDARIREQLRQGLNAIDFLGLISDDKGSWGSLYGEKGTDGMGYTKDGKTKVSNDPSENKTSSTKPGKMTPFDYLKEQGLEVEDLEDGTNRIVHVYNPKVKSEDGTHQGLKVSGTYKGKDQISTEQFINSHPAFNIKKLKRIANDTKPKGIMRALTGALDFMTGGMFDFDQRNREGAPKDFGIRRIAGGLADWATMGLTDFDKRGAGNLQFNPIFGGKDKAWGSRNEQAKRREKQSGFGLKRGIGGLLDFATLGMFDFDKQNRRGAPKGFGIKRIVGGVADVLTGGTTDFDKRGSGLLQYSGFTGRRMQRPSRTRSHSSYVDKYMKIAGERFIPDQPLTERQYQVATMGMQMGNKYNDDVLRSYAMYEEQNVSADPEVIVINKNTTVPVKVGGTEVMMVGSGSNGGSSDESYASYQGH